MRMADRIAETCTVTGATNPFTLTGALSASYRRFRGKYADGKAGLGYVAKTTQASPNGPKIEIGKLATLTYGTPNDSLSRGTVIGSSNSDTAVDWLASDIVIVYQAPLIEVAHAIVQPDFVGPGAGNLIINTANAQTYFGQVVEFDVTAANRTLTLGSAGASLGHGYVFDVYGYGSTSNGVILTPGTGEAFNEQSANATLTVAGGVQKTVRWNDTRGVWIVR